MIRVTALEDAEPRPRRVAIGTFDGVHIGHREVIEGADTVLTFDPHPLEVLHPAAAPKLIMPFGVKRDVLDGIGIEEMVVIGFNEDFTKTSAEQFIEQILVEQLSARQVAVGENFRFGTGAKGTPQMLAAHPEFDTRIVPLVQQDGETVSSSRIRALVAAGEVAQARDCLGVPFMLEGTVVGGDRRGRELGYPGVRPTFESGRGVLIEAYLLDQDVDLYGQSLRVAFVERLRGERRFDSAEALIEQMKLDVEETARVCASFQRP